MHQISAPVSLKYFDILTCFDDSPGIKNKVLQIIIICNHAHDLRKFHKQACGIIQTLTGINPHSSLKICYPQVTARFLVL